MDQVADSPVYDAAKWSQWLQGFKILKAQLLKETPESLL